MLFVIFLLSFNLYIFNTNTAYFLQHHLFYVLMYHSSDTFPFQTNSFIHCPPFHPYLSFNHFLTVQLSVLTYFSIFHLLSTFPSLVTFQSFVHCLLISSQLVSLCHSFISIPSPSLPLSIYISLYIFISHHTWFSFRFSLDFSITFHTFLSTSLPSCLTCTYSNSEGCPIRQMQHTDPG